MISPRSRRPASSGGDHLPAHPELRRALREQRPGRARAVHVVPGGLRAVGDVGGGVVRVAGQADDGHGEAGRPAAGEAHDRAAVGVVAPAVVVLQQVRHLARLDVDPGVQARGVRRAEGREQGEGGLFRALQRGLDRLLGVYFDVLGHELQLVGPVGVLLCAAPELLGLRRAAVADVHAVAYLRGEAVEVVIELRVGVPERDLDGQVQRGKAVGQPVGRDGGEHEDDEHEQRLPAPPPASPAPAPPARRGLVHVFDLTKRIHCSLPYYFY